MPDGLGLIDRSVWNSSRSFAGIVRVRADDFCVNFHLRRAFEQSAGGTLPVGDALVRGNQVVVLVGARAGRHIQVIVRLRPNRLRSG